MSVSGARSPCVTLVGRASHWLTWCVTLVHGASHWFTVRHTALVHGASHWFTWCVALAHLVRHSGSPCVTLVHRASHWFTWCVTLVRRASHWFTVRHTGSPGASHWFDVRHTGSPGASPVPPQDQLRHEKQQREAAVRQAEQLQRERCSLDNDVAVSTARSDRPALFVSVFAPFGVHCVYILPTAPHFDSLCQVVPLGP